MEEIWKELYFEEDGIVYDYRNLYKVSNLGHIKSVFRKENIKGEILKDGYIRVNLMKKRFLLHRLIAHMFVEGYFNGAEVDHINTIRNDNRAENLRWVTKEENMNNPLTKINLSDALSGENNPMYGTKGELSPNYGKPCSEEKRKTISEAKIGKTTKVSERIVLYNKETNELYCYNTIGYASKQLENIKECKFNKSRLADVAKYYHNPKKFIEEKGRTRRQYKGFVVYYYNDAPKELIDLLKED